MNFDVRKVELTPLEQRKLTFDSHAMVTELEGSGEEATPSLFPGTFSSSAPCVFPRRSGEAPGGADRLGSRHSGRRQHGRRLQRHGDQIPPGTRREAADGFVLEQHSELLPSVFQEIAVQQIMAHLDSIRKDMVILEKSEFANLRSENAVRRSLQFAPQTPRSFVLTSLYLLFFPQAMKRELEQLQNRLKVRN